MKHDPFIQFPVVQCAFRHQSLQILCCNSGRFWLLHCLLLWRLWVHGYLFIMSDVLCLSCPMIALNLMEAVPCSPIKVLRFCSKLDYGCGAWNVWLRLASSGSTYFYFECLSLPQHLSWNRQLSMFPLTLHSMTCQMSHTIPGVPKVPECWISADTIADIDPVPA